MGSASLGGWSFCRFRPGWSEFQLRNPRLSCVRQFLLETAHVLLEVLNLVRAGAGRPAKLYVALVLLDLQLFYPEIDVSRLFAHARAHFLRQPFTGCFLVGRADNGQWRWVADKIRHCDYMINATGTEPPPRR